MDLGEFGWSSKKLMGLGVEVEEACVRFWSKNQIIGFDKDGKAIRTNIPRIRPDKDIFHDWNTASGSSEVFGNKPKKPGQYPLGGHGGI